MPQNNETSRPKRLLSLDALRGFDMFWIIGGKYVFIALAAVTGFPVLEWWSTQLNHVDWHGFKFYDMIFPLFLFISGVSFPFSLANKYSKVENRKKLYTDILRRGLILVVLGLIYSNSIRFDLENLRFGSVLGRIGLAWMFAALIYINTNSFKIRVLFFWGIILVYWGLLVFFPATDLGSTDIYSPEGNLAGYIDRLFMPGKLMTPTHDPEGILSTFPAISTALLGMLIGEYLQSKALRDSPMLKLLYMVLAGILLTLLGQIWSYTLPINKTLWTGSFVCYVGGLSILLLSAFYLVIDIWQFQRWAFFFIIIGMNSITIYMAKKMIDFKYTASFLFGGMAKVVPENWSGLVLAVGYLTVAWLLLYFLYRNKVFLKI